MTMELDGASWSYGTSAILRFNVGFLSLFGQRPG
jgi:hypothetical protein